jgi:hypothetical protein
LGNGGKGIFKDWTNIKCNDASHKQRLARKVKPFTVKVGVFYKFGCDNKLKQCLFLEVLVILKKVHEGTIGWQFVVEHHNKEGAKHMVIVVNFVQWCQLIL